MQQPFWLLVSFEDITSLCLLLKFVGLKSYCINYKISVSQPATLAFAKSDDREAICSGVSGEWEDGRCNADIDSDNEDEIAEEKTAIDNALCDDQKMAYKFEECN